ncbi:molybdenum cofactor biosynthesis protein MoaE [Phaeobacter inhibens]|uniref:Molybdopterin synthase catalytic subunit n=1 Tax=Phaeobacter inhibens TaxID=221822 RepID=A0ABN5GQN5_9RHOB|nr:molybdenum cofactor biosynthesis protein MoaE [Phaeobacter inhibens]AUQ51321.1 molybdopterin-converting factor subunit 2 [Phaeobacter inhibens]AUQ67808.1 molybdopterin-converting factor subunit 2 [Phaeobacter inhibens]AUQ95840.1 molybdopterin-converting factor subunit 2 [Phaeobacter inhibens]AUR21126.1 molybdopterin-converting factor subunit 2 [Phaeobacter inhibens]UWR60997.1 molybdenum cofactor biosynthesis protein MoaE [Phaeobacter inhibens]
MRIAVQKDAFDLGEESQRFASDVATSGVNAGALVTFTGVVRGSEKGDMVAMEIEHYPGMTERAIETITQEAQQRWSLADALVIHRHGRLVPGEQIMMVATAARHRSDAFEAAEYLMDYLKSRAPFWKKEMTQDGTGNWVEAKDSDEEALTRWD